MPRLARIVLPGLPHHITQRGNNRLDVFFVDSDRIKYLEILSEQSALYGLSVEAYCLMTNHIHLVATPSSEESLAKAVGRTHFLYTQYINKMHGRSGHLWQNRFFSCAMDEAHYLTALRYVERNPVRAKMVRKPWRYEWSSAAEHIGEGAPLALLDMDRWEDLKGRLKWKDFLTEKDAEGVEAMRLATHRGRPLASDSFLSKLETKLNRRLRPLTVGRPKGKKDTKKRRKNR
jgi:putative transposase